MARYCWNCGKELEEKSKFCSDCGTKNEQREEKKEKEDNNRVVEAVNANNNEDRVAVATNVPKQTNGFAIAGFVISLISMLCCGILSWLGLIFSIIGLVKANKLNGEGKGLAIAGITISAIFVLMLILLYILGVTSVIATDFTEFA